MKKQILFFVTAILILSFSSCKKEDDTSNLNGVISSGSWKLVASTSVTDFSSSGGGIVTSDLYDLLDECQKDNISTFNANGTGTLDEGATKCDASYPQTTENAFGWEIANNKLTTTSTNPLVPILTSDILQLDNSTLKIKYNTNLGGYPSTTTTTYTKI